MLTSLLKKNRNGFVLPLVVVITIVLSMLGASLLSMATAARIKTNREIDEVFARSAADAGLDIALYQMNKKLSEPVWDNGALPLTEETPLLHAFSQYSFKVEGDVTAGFEISSNGTAGAAQKTVYSSLKLASPFESAVAVKERIRLYPGTIVDGYNSITHKTGLPTRLATNSTKDDSVVIASGSMVVGDIQIGLGGDIGDVVKGSGEVTGEIYNMSQTITFPEVEAPVLPKKGSIDLEKDTLTITPADSGQYHSISLSDSILKIAGGNVILHVTDDIHIGHDCEIEIAPNASLKLYIDDDIELKEGAGINNKGKIPGNLQIYGLGDSGQDIDLKSNNEFYGMIYAPNATVSINAGGDIYGSIVAESFVAKSKSNFHHDMSLAENVSITDAAVSFVVRDWREE